MLHTTPLVFTSFSWGVMVCWIALVVANAVGGRKLGLWEPLSTTELAVAFILGTVGSSMTTTEVAGLLVTNPSGVMYYATPENRWLETFGPLMPTWLIPPDTHSSVTWMYVGRPPGESVVWGDWISAIFWNGSFAASMYCIQFALVALLRKHWVEHERLTFPIMQVPLEIIRPPEKGMWRPPWTRSRLFWIGFSVPFTFVMLQIGHWFWPGVPQIPTNLGNLSFGLHYPNMPMRIFWPVIAVSFFANTEVIFSLWFFNLVGTLATGWMNRLGLLATGTGQEMKWLNMGALMTMVVWFMWQARHHLGAAWRRAFRGGDEDDSREFLSYRTAWLVLGFGAMYMLFWLRTTGMAFGIAILLIVASQLIYLGIARLAFEAGVLHVNSPMHTCHMIADALGPASMSSGSLAGLSLVFWKFSNVKSLFLVSFGHGAALSDTRSPAVDVPRRKLTGAVVPVVIITTLVAVWYTMYLGYSYGGFNFGDFVFSGSAQEPYKALYLWLTAPKEPDTSGVTFWSIGALLMGFFTWMRYLLPWWPLHPIGLAISFSFHISTSFLSFLIAGSAKSLLMRLGGVRLYRQAIPAFIGLLIGSLAGGTIAFVVDYLYFPLSGHAVFYH